jgi:hypothetical protein
MDALSLYQMCTITLSNDFFEWLPRAGMEVMGTEHGTYIAPP